eukprot:355262-Chlamydomonas_euryale.AAC.1
MAALAASWAAVREAAVGWGEYACMGCAWHCMRGEDACTVCAWHCMTLFDNAHGTAWHCMTLHGTV